MGEGKLGEGELLIPEEMRADTDSLIDLVNTVFPSFETNFNNATWVGRRAIISPSNKEVEEVLMEFGRGIQHVVEATDLQPLFEAWASPSEKEKEAAEQKINDFFSETLNVLFIPAQEVEASKRKELKTILKEWNSSHDNKGK